MVAYNRILEASTHAEAMEYARGINWQEVGTGIDPVPVSDVRYIGTVNGVNVYYNVVADYHLFTPAK